MYTPRIHPARGGRLSATLTSHPCTTKAAPHNPDAPTHPKSSKTRPRARSVDKSARHRRTSLHAPRTRAHNSLSHDESSFQRNNRGRVDVLGHVCCQPTRPRPFAVAQPPMQAGPIAQTYLCWCLRFGVEPLPQFTLTQELEDGVLCGVTPSRDLRPGAQVSQPSRRPPMAPQPLVRCPPSPTLRRWVFTVWPGPTSGVMWR